MSWTTVYINGKKGFKKAVLTKLDGEWLHGASEAGQQLIMFWLSDQSKLRDFKLAIGSKTIFKYRIYFFTNLDEYLKSESSKSEVGLTIHENSMIRDMVMWEKNTKKLDRPVIS